MWLVDYLMWNCFSSSMCTVPAQYAHFNTILDICPWYLAWPVLSCNACNTLHLMGIVRPKRVHFRIPSIGEHTYMIVLMKQHWVLNLITQFQAMLCVCAHQDLEFWNKLFWSLLYPSNVMCYMHCMIVLTMLSWPNAQYEAKICTLCSSG